MKKRRTDQNRYACLRQRAEELLQSQPNAGLEKLTAEDTEHLIHEILVHQIELEMQNDELRRIQEALEMSRSKYADLYDFAPLSYFTFDKNGLVLEANLTGARLLGVERSHLINKPFSVFVEKDQQDLFYLYCRKVFDTSYRQTCEIRLKKKDGTIFYAQMESILVEDPQSTKTCRTTIIDITRSKQGEEALRLGNQVIEASPEHISIVDRNYIYRYVNRTYTEVHGLSADHIVGKHVADLSGKDVFEELSKPFLDRCFAGEEIKYESWFQFRNRGRRYMLVNYLPLRDKSGHIDSLVVFSQDITGHKETEEELQRALKESKRREKEILALQKSSHSVLTCRKFGDAARSIFDACKDLIGASAGYVALLSNDGKKNQVLFLDAGRLPCSVDPLRQMPVRGLREKSYQTGKTVYHNEFAGSEWVKYLPEGHVPIDNVLFSPLVIECKTVGLLGLANKHGGFTENDAVMASAFGELAAIALINSRNMGALRNSEERLRSVVETANDVIITIDRVGNIVSCNNAAESVFGYSCGEIIGKQLTLLMPERFREFHIVGVSRLLEGRKPMHVGKTMELVALHKDGREFPIELSIARWKTTEGDFFTGIVRDITVRKKIEEELKRAKEDLEIKVQNRTEELQLAVGLLQEEVYDRKEAEEKILFYQGQLRTLMSKLDVVEEEERKRISEHIHDNISQNLAISKMNLESLQEKFPLTANELIQTRELIDETIGFIRSLTFELSPPILHELGLIAAVEWLADKVRERYGIIVESKTDRKFRTLKGETGILLFRTIRELLHNIVKHAKAVNARVSIQGYGDYMEIKVEDDGAGFDASELNDYIIKGESFGIASIRERISYLNGNFEIHSRPGEGTKVRIIVPVHK